MLNDKKLRIVTWFSYYRWLATKGHLNETADQFGMGVTTLYMCIYKVCTAINTTLRSSISFPETPEEQQTVIAECSSLIGFSNIIGAVGSSHIPVKRPQTNEQHAYCNNKGFHSMVLQGAVKADGNFTDVYCAWPGSAHDSRVFRHSSLSQRDFPSHAW